MTLLGSEEIWDTGKTCDYLWQSMYWPLTKFGAHVTDWIHCGIVSIGLFEKIMDLGLERPHETARVLLIKLGLTRRRCLVDCKTLISFNLDQGRSPGAMCPAAGFDQIGGRTQKNSQKDTENIQKHKPPSYYESSSTSKKI